MFDNRTEFKLQFAIRAALRWRKHGLCVNSVRLSNARKLNLQTNELNKAQVLRIVKIVIGE